MRWHQRPVRGLSERSVLAGGVLAAIVAIGLLAFLPALSAVRGAAGEDAELDHALSQIGYVKGLAVDLETSAQGFVLTGDPEFLQPWQAARRVLPEAAARMVTDVSEAAGMEGLARGIQRAALAYLKGYSAPLVRLAQQRRATAARVIVAKSGERQMDALRRRFARLESDVLALSARQDRQSHAAATTATRIGIGVGVALMLLILAVTLYLTSRVSRPIAAIAAAAKKFGSGAHALAPEAGAPEIRQLARSFNAMADARSALREQFTARNADLETMQEELERANAAKTDFLSRTSHELKTPLNAILGFAQLLELDETDPERGRHVGHILRGGRHLLGLIDELLSLSRIERGELQISPEPVDVHVLLDEVVSLVDPLAADNDVTIRSDRPDRQALYVTADHLRLKQVLLNLLSNALKYNQLGGCVKIGCERIGSEEVRIEVFNTSDGLTLAEQQKIFIRFERLAQNSAGVEGTGLGLPLSRNLVELMGGELSVSSEIGVGSTFSVVLPQAPAPALGERILEAPPEASGVERGHGGHAVILYVEDNPANYQLVERALALRGPTEVLAASQGSIGIDLAQSQRPDLVLLDLHLPDMTGERALERLKANPQTSGIPVVILTADIGAGKVSRLIDAGAEAYLTKPLDVSLFLRTVEHVLGATAGVGGMIPDSLRDSRILVVDDEPANVALLESLLRRWGVSDVVATTNSSEVVELCSVGEPDLILLDLHMPPPDGFEVLSQLTPWIRGVAPVPVLVLTADASNEVKRRALAHGARDFVAKPFDLEEVRLRTTNLLEARRLQRDLHLHGELLEQRIRERTGELQEARTDVLQRLARAAEYRDDATGEHTRRVGRSARLIAIELGLGGGAAEQLALAAPLHDVGKIAIPDAILLKPGPLTESEFEQMKQHVVIGAELLAGSTSPVLEAARQIALNHHERWEGAGYPRGIAGVEIPVEGRIVAVADVFDALTHERSYKAAWSTGRAVETVIEDAGRAFDPDVVEAFAALNHEHLLAPIESARRMRLVVAKPPDCEALEPEVLAAAHANGSTRSVAPAVAAKALSVSPTTLRRWSDSGRIDVQRTAGGHRRFPVDEIRRLRVAGGRESGGVQTVLPPTEGIAALTELLADRGKEIHERSANGMYRERGEGWFQSDEADELAGNWVKSLRAAASSGDYEPAMIATSALTHGAELAGTTLLERYTYVERFSEACLRILVAPGTCSRSEVVASRRLFASMRQLVLRQTGDDG